MTNKNLRRRVSIIALTLLFLIGSIAAAGTGTLSFPGFLRSPLVVAGADDFNGTVKVIVYLNPKNLNQDQVFVDFQVSGDDVGDFITNQGAVGIWYDPVVLEPSTLDWNDPSMNNIPIENEEDFYKAVEIPHTVVYSTDDNYKPGRTYPQGGGSAALEILTPSEEMEGADDEEVNGALEGSDDSGEPDTIVPEEQMPDEPKETDPVDPEEPEPLEETEPFGELRKHSILESLIPKSAEAPEESEPALAEEEPDGAAGEEDNNVEEEESGQETDPDPDAVAGEESAGDQTPDRIDDVTSLTATPGVIWLDELFYSLDSAVDPIYGGIAVNSSYSGWDASAHYVTLQYWPFFYRGEPNPWTELQDVGLSNGKQLYVSLENFPGITDGDDPGIDPDDPEVVPEPGLVMMRMSFKVLGDNELRYNSLNFSNLRYEDGELATNDDDETYKVYIQNGEIQGVKNPYFYDASLIIVVMDYPPPPIDPTAINNGDYTATVYVPEIGIADVKDEDGNVVERGFQDYVPSGTIFNVYLSDDEMAASRISVDPAWITDYIYEMDGSDPTKKGAYFTINLPGDPSALTGDDLTAYDMLKEILDSYGTVYLSTVYLNNESIDVENNDELLYTPALIPKAIRLTMDITSYAPAHETVVTLYRFKDLDGMDPDNENDYESDAAFTFTMVAKEGVGRWKQQFRPGSSELAGTYIEETHEEEIYKMVIGKPSHITYTKMNVVIKGVKITDPDAEGFDPNASEFEQTLKDEIILFCGDINGDGRIKLNDRGYLLKYVNDSSLWRVKDEDDPKNPIDPINPESTAHLMDLDGDGKITIHDVNILMHEDNFNKSVDDYYPKEGES